MYKLKMELNLNRPCRLHFRAYPRLIRVPPLQDLRFFNISTDVQDKPDISTNNTKYHTIIRTYLDISTLFGSWIAYE